MVSSEPAIRFNRLTTENGLSNNNVTGLTRDDNGFMWFATFDGLNRWDGYNSKVYRSDPDDPSSLSGNQLRSVYKDRSGTIWVGAWSDGLNRFVPETETFVRYKHDPDNPNSLSHDAVAIVFEDSAGIFWIGTRGGGLNRFDPKTEQFTRYQHDPEDPGSLGPGFVMDVMEDSQGQLWLSNNGSLNRLDPVTGKIKRYNHDPANAESLVHNTVHTTCEDRTGAIWVGTSGGLDRFDRETESFTHFRHDPVDPNSLGYNYVTGCMEDEAENFWVFLYGGGVNLLDRESGTFTRYPHEPGDPDSPSSNNIFIHHQDQSGLIWMGTYGGGASYFDLNAKQFVNYRHNPSFPGSLSHNTVRPVYVDSRGTLWVGTLNKGLNRLDSKTGKLTRFQHDANNPQSLSSNNIRAIFEDREGVLWVGTYGGGLNRFDPETETFTRYRHVSNDPNSLSDNQIYSLYEDRSGVFWVGTWTKGLEILDRESGTFTRYPHNPDDSGSISHNGIVSFHEDSSDTLWIGTYGGGLNRYDREKRRFDRYQHNPDDPHSLSNNTIFDMHEDRAGAFWIATGRGLNRFDPQTGRFRHYFQKDGLPNDVVYSVKEDGQGSLWLSTNQGIARFDPKAETFRNYDKGDGIQGNQFNSLAHAQGPDGRIYFGGSNGLTAFYPEDILDNPRVPPVVITDIQLANKPVPIGEDSILKKSALETDEITLTYLDQVISFEFAALNFQAPEKNRYRYRLEGFEETWNEATSDRRFVTYTNLDPGNYIFRVTGSNNDGVWNEEGDAIRLTVTPPWWETWWAYAIYLGLAVLSVISVIQFRTYALNRKRIELEALVVERTEELVKAKQGAEAANHAKSVFLANMSHELRTPLNAILGFSEMIGRDSDTTAKTREKISVINSSGEHLHEMINDVLDLSKIEAGRVELEPEAFDLLKMLQDISRMFETRAESADLSFYQQFDPELPRYISIDAGKLRQILINLLGNAVKFTQQGQFTLRAEAEPIEGDAQRTTLVLEVEDTGLGIPADQLEHIFEPFSQAGHSPSSRKGTGLGLSISRSFAELMGGEIGVESSEGAGSLFRIRLPVALVDSIKAVDEKQARPIVVHLAAGQAPWRVLIVEDDLSNRLLLRSLLEEVGFEVREVENGKQAIALFQEWDPHFIWMDMRMPVMGGYEATSRIRELPGGDKVKIVALTASVFKEQLDQILRAGCDDLLRKPYQVGDIFRVMAQHLDVRYLTQEEKEGLPEELQSDLTSEALAQLPQELRNDLSKAALSLSTEAVTGVLEQIEQIDADTARSLETLAENYQFKKILELLKR
ncbi:MAG: two-component regulator propeller domain-containing protein [Sedimenticola sp.]